MVRLVSLKHFSYTSLTPLTRYLPDFGPSFSALYGFTKYPEVNLAESRA
jgi:hypothetical protein